MSFLEPIIRELSQKFGLGTHAGALAMEALRTITNERAGGLTGFINRFESAGLGDLAHSWVGKGENEPVAPGQLEAALGGDVIGKVAAKVGLSASAAGAALAFIVPKLIDRLTPDGVVPSALPTEVSALLSGGAPRAAVAADTGPTGPSTAYAAAATAGSKPGGGLLRKFLPLLGLLLLSLLAYWVFGGSGEKIAEAPSATATAPSASAPAASATAPAKPDAAVTANPSQLALQNADGRIFYAGSAPDEQSKSKIVDALNSVFGTSAVTGSLGIDSSAAAPAWLDKLTAALGQFKIPGAEMLLKGDSVDIGGLLSDEAKNNLIAGLKSVFGEDVSVGKLTESLAGTLAAAKAMVPAVAAGSPAAAGVGRSAEGAQAANEKALAALKSLPPGYSANDLVEVLNASVITFETGSAVIAASDRGFLRTVANGISGAPAGSTVEIGGHTDGTGNAEANLALSQARADAVRAELIGFGSNPAMLVAKGYGGTRPVASDDTVEGREHNRRIEFTVVK
jgi:outer membrane protein OmpA-like peptidoglycan-associated protein/uncharacterized protein YidB (DUF937 family)